MCKRSTVAPFFCVLERCDGFDKCYTFSETRNIQAQDGLHSLFSTRSWISHWLRAENIHVLNYFGSADTNWELTAI